MSSVTLEEKKSLVREFPLYDKLYNELMERDKKSFTITKAYREKLASILCSLGRNDIETILALIVHNYFLSSSINPFGKNNATGKPISKLPYDMRTSRSGKGISFNIGQLPIMLQGMLGIYCGL